MVGLSLLTISKLVLADITAAYEYIRIRNRHTMCKKIHESVVSSSFIVPHQPEDIYLKKKKNTESVYEISTR